MFILFLFVYRNKFTLFQSSLLPFVPRRLVNVVLQCASFILFFSFTLLCSVSLGRGCELCFSPKPPLWAVQPFCPLLSSAIVLQTAGGSMANWIMGQQSTFLSAVGLNLLAPASIERARSPLRPGFIEPCMGLYAVRARPCPHPSSIIRL